MTGVPGDHAGAQPRAIIDALTSSAERIAFTEQQSLGLPTGQGLPMPPHELHPLKQSCMHVEEKTAVISVTVATFPIHDV